jgi:putative endonuclease
LLSIFTGNIGLDLTKKYNLTKLVYFEETSDVRSAIEREKQLKNWHRDWKIKLITDFNPEWKDLSVEGKK